MNKFEKGFSLVELLLVVVIIGIIAAISIAFLNRAVGASRNANAFASLKTLSSVQLSYFVKNKRFARLDELNAEMNNDFGQINGTNLERGYFTMTMTPPNPTDSQLQNDFVIIATKPATNTDTPCILSLNASGEITELFGTNCINDD